MNEAQDKALGMLKMGATAPTAFACVGIAPAVGATWLASPEFAAAADQATALFEMRMLKRLNDDESGAGARWLLERRFPDRYGPAALKATAEARAAATVEEAQPAEPGTALERAELRRRQGRPQLAVVPAD
jgi:hypothetical protein